MKSRVTIVSLAVAALAALYLMVPACGSNNNQPAATYYPGTTCIPGQICAASTLGLTGTALLPGMVVASIDSMGSTVQLQFGATSGTTYQGQAYNGPVSIAGVVNFVGSGGCPAGSYQLTGQGQWVANYGGKVAGVQGSFQLVGGAYGQMQGQINGTIGAGQDPNAPNVPSQYYLQGLFGTSCNPGGVAL